MSDEDGEMSELQAQAAAAVEAVARARITAQPNLVRLTAVKYLREATRLGLPEAVVLVDSALGKPGPTRAAKEKAVAGLDDKHAWENRDMLERVLKVLNVKGATNGGEGDDAS